ncbi:MAG: hypothetical protein QXD48_02110 [Candidatus Aenigmatarchaeota archaeon]
MKIYYALLFIICISMIFITFNSQIEDELNINIKTAPESNFLTAVTTEEKIELNNTYITANGMLLTLHEIENNENVTKTNIIIEFNNEKKTFDVFIPPYESFTYATLDSFVIIPKRPSSINTYNTSYYKMGNELYIEFLSPIDEIYVFLPNLPSPGIVVADSNIEWRFNERIVHVKSIDGSFSKVTMFWFEHTKPGTLFLEDTKNIESILNNIFIFNNNITLLTNKLHTTANSVAMLEKEVENLKSMVEDARSQKLYVEHLATNMSNKNKELENVVTSNILMSPTTIFVAIIVFVIIILLLIDVIFFRPKEVKPRE